MAGSHDARSIGSRYIILTAIIIHAAGPLLVRVASKDTGLEAPLVCQVMQVSIMKHRGVDFDVEEKPPS
jgi:hypothetical protein